MVWKQIGVTYSSLQHHEGGNRPSQNNLKKYLKFYGCDEVWLITGRGRPFSGQDDKDIGVGEIPSIVPEGDGVDFSVQAGILLSNILKSGDQVMIQAIISNLRAFNRAVETQQRDKDRITKLENEYGELKERLDALEEKHKQTNPHTVGSSQKAVI